jgi:hypothetical protein
MRIEILWFDGCPNHEHARALLQDVLRARGVEQPVDSIDVSDPAIAESVRFPGSPTIRVDGVDIEPGFEDPGDYAIRCRVYRTANGQSGVPEREWIEAALNSSGRR